MIKPTLKLLFSILFITSLSNNLANNTNYKLSVNAEYIESNTSDTIKTFKIVEILKKIKVNNFDFQTWQYAIESKNSVVTDSCLILKLDNSNDSSFLNTCLLSDEIIVISEFEMSNNNQSGQMGTNLFNSKIIILKKNGQTWNNITLSVIPKELPEYILNEFLNSTSDKNGIFWLTKEWYDTHAPRAIIQNNKILIEEINVLGKSHGILVELEWKNNKFEIISRKRIAKSPKLDIISNEKFAKFLSGFKLIELPEIFAVDKYYLNNNLKTIPEEFYNFINFSGLTEYNGIWLKVDFSKSIKAEYVGIIKIAEQFVAIAFRTVEEDDAPNRKSIVLATYKPNGTFINSIVITKGGDENISTSIEKSLIIKQELHSPGEGSTEYAFKTYKLGNDGIIKLIMNKKETRNW